MDKAEISEEELSTLIDKDLTDLFQSFETESKEVLLVLQFHLHSENMLERVILSNLERGDKLLEKAGLSFHQKVCLVESFNVLEDRYIESLRKINKLRNNCAHMKSASISQHDIDLIGRPLGKIYTQIVKGNNGSLEFVLVEVRSTVGSHLVSRTLGSEYNVVPKHQQV